MSSNTSFSISISLPELLVCAYFFVYHIIFLFRRSLCCLFSTLLETCMWGVAIRHRLLHCCWRLHFHYLFCLGTFIIKVLLSEKVMYKLKRLHRYLWILKLKLIICILLFAHFYMLPSQYLETLFLSKCVFRFSYSVSDDSGFKYPYCIRSSRNLVNVNEWKGTSRQRSGKGAIRKRFPLLYGSSCLIPVLCKEVRHKLLYKVCFCSCFVSLTHI